MHHFRGESGEQPCVLTNSDLNNMRNYTNQPFRRVADAAARPKRQERGQTLESLDCDSIIVVLQAQNLQNPATQTQDNIL